MAEKRARRLKIFLTVVTLLAMGGLIYTVRDQIAETIANLSSVNRYALLLMIPAQMLNYHSYTRLYQGLFIVLGHRIRYKKLLRITSELNFVNNVFPSGGVSGFSYFGMRMKSHGVSAGTATLVQMTRFILVFISFQVFLLVGLFFLAIGGKASNFLILIAASLATFLVVGTAVAIFIIGSKRRIQDFFSFLTRTINKLIHVFRPKNPETISVERAQKTVNELHDQYMVLKKNPKMLRRPLMRALMANFAEVLTIYVVYVAFGTWVNPGAVIIAYAVANFAGLVSVLPGGVGIYEALMTAVLVSAGVPAGLSISVTIMYRILNMTLQLPIGYILYHRAINENKLIKTSS